MSLTDEERMWIGLTALAVIIISIVGVFWLLGTAIIMVLS